MQSKDSTDRTIKVYGRAHPFKAGNTFMEFPEGTLLSEIVSGFRTSPYIASDISVFVEDVLIPSKYWKNIRPKADSTVSIATVPMGGGGGDDSNKTRRTLINIVILIASIYTGNALTGWRAALAVAAINIAGGYVRDQVAPPPTTDLDDLSDDRPGRSRQYGIQGARNSIDQFGTVPLVLGKHRVVPPYGAQPYTEMDGSWQYLRCLFTIGYGPLKITDLQIGDTPIGDYRDVDVAIYNGTGSHDYSEDLFGSIVLEDDIGATIVEDWTVRTTEPDTDEIGIEVVYPQGLIQYSDSGKPQHRTVEMDLEYREVGTTEWLPIEEQTYIPAKDIEVISREDGEPPDPNQHDFDNLVMSGRVVMHKKSGHVTIITADAGTPAYREHYSWSLAVWDLEGLGFTITDTRPAEVKKYGSSNFEVSTGVGGGVLHVADGAVDLPVIRFERGRTQTSFRRGKILRVPRGQYEVRIRRTTSEGGTDIYDTVVWAKLRSIRREPPITMDGVAKVALRIKATDQLNGIIDKFNCVAESIMLDWDSVNQVWARRTTSNPASMYRYLLQGPMRRSNKKIDDSKIDLEALQDWHEFCVSKGFEVNSVIDFDTTLLQSLHDICGSGRASFNIIDGVYSVIQDKPKSDIVQHISPRNSSQFKGMKAFPDKVHGIKVRFVDADNGWRQEEVTVYDDGWDETNATNVEGLDLFGITSYEQAWKMARYQLAIIKLRPEVYSVKMDIEHIAFNRGDRCKLMNDAAMLGIASGRIKEVVMDGTGTDAVGFIADELFEMETGKSYAVRIRFSDLGSVEADIVTDDTAGYEVTFSIPLSGADIPSAGDLYMFGETGMESRDVVVKSITPEDDLVASVSFVDYAPGVFTADEGEIPPFDPFGQGGSELVPFAPPAPIIENVRSGFEIFKLRRDGTHEPRILVSCSWPSPTVGVGPWTLVEIQYREHDTDQDPDENWQSVAEVPTESNDFYLSSVEEQEEYDIRVRSKNENFDLVSDWSVVEAHQVGGLPPGPAAPNNVIVNARHGHITVEVEADNVNASNIDTCLIIKSATNNRDDDIGQYYRFPVPASFGAASAIKWPRFAAELVSDLNTLSFVIREPLQSTKYFWVRFDTKDGIQGDWFPSSPTNGIQVEVPQDRQIFVSQFNPGSGDGGTGDIWFKYK